MYTFSHIIKNISVVPQELQNIFASYSLSGVISLLYQNVDVVDSDKRLHFKVIQVQSRPFRSISANISAN